MAQKTKIPLRLDDPELMKNRENYVLVQDPINIYQDDKKSDNYGVYEDDKKSGNYGIDEDNKKGNNYEIDGGPYVKQESKVPIIPYRPTTKVLEESEKKRNINPNAQGTPGRITPTPKSNLSEAAKLPKSPVTPAPSQAPAAQAPAAQAPAAQAPADKDLVIDNNVPDMYDRPKLTPSKLSEIPVEDPNEIKARDAVRQSDEANNNTDWSEIWMGVVPSLVSLFSGESAGYKIGGKAMMDWQTQKFKTDQDIRKMLVKRAISGGKEGLKPRIQNYWDEPTQQMRAGNMAINPQTGLYELVKSPNDPVVNSLSQNPNAQIETQGIRLAKAQAEQLLLGKGWQKYEDDLGQTQFINPGSDMKLSVTEAANMVRNGGLSSLGGVPMGGQTGRTFTTGGFRQSGPIGQRENTLSKVERSSQEKVLEGWNRIRKEADEKINSGITGLNYLSDPAYAVNTPAIMQAVTNVVRQTEKGVLTDDDFYRYYRPYGLRGKLDELRNWWTQNTHVDPQTGEIRFNKGVQLESQRRNFIQLLESGTLQNLSKLEEDIYNNNQQGQGSLTPESLQEQYNTRKARFSISNGKMPIKVVSGSGKGRKEIRSMFIDPSKLEAIRQSAAKQGHSVIEL